MVPIYPRMSSEERVRAGLAATELIRDRLRAHFGHLNPGWTAEEVERAVAARLLEGRVTG
ncbi:hypothetical protein BH23GEM11_BH23GEM11_19010 [soil metagenome]